LGKTCQHEKVHPSLRLTTDGKGKSMKLPIGHLTDGLYLLIVWNEKDIVAYRFAKQ
jgi:hypothetical protein